MDDLISRQAALEAMDTWDKFGCNSDGKLVKCDDGKQYIPYVHYEDMVHAIKHLPSAQPKIVRCKDCKYWRRATAYGKQLLFGYCESDEMWQSLYGETYEVAHIDTEEDHYCSYGERKDDGRSD